MLGIHRAETDLFPQDGFQKSFPVNLSNDFENLLWVRTTSSQRTELIIFCHYCPVLRLYWRLIKIRPSISLVTNIKYTNQFQDKSSPLAALWQLGANSKCIHTADQAVQLCHLHIFTCRNQSIHVLSAHLVFFPGIMARSRSRSSPATFIP